MSEDVPQAEAIQPSSEIFSGTWLAGTVYLDKDATPVDIEPVERDGHYGIAVHDYVTHEEIELLPGVVKISHVIDPATGKRVRASQAVCLPVPQTADGRRHKDELVLRFSPRPKMKELGRRAILRSF